MSDVDGVLVWLPDLVGLRVDDCVGAVDSEAEGLGVVVEVTLESELADPVPVGLWLCV